MAERDRADAYMRIDRGQHDRFRRTRVYADELIQAGTRRYGTWRAPTIPTDTATRHTVTSADVGHMDAIAKKYYNDERLWWVIAWVNRIKNPITDMVVGQQLLIPELAEIAPAIADTI